jgi:hypothetical protein
MNIPVATPRGVARRWIAAFNAADADALAALYHDDAVNHQVALKPVRGRLAIHAQFARELRKAAVERVPLNLFEDGEWAILEWKDVEERPGCTLFHVIDGRIALQRGYWDSAAFTAKKAPVKARAAKARAASKA